MKMKYLIYALGISFLAIASMTAASCTKEILEEPASGISGNGDDEEEEAGDDGSAVVEKKAMDFVTDFPNSFTKTSLNGQQVLWSENDALSIFDGTDNNRFTITSGAGENVGNFTGKAYEASEYYALYPYSESASYADGMIYAELPSVQTATEASFATMLNPSVGVSTGTALRLANIAGLISFTIEDIPSGQTVQSVVFEAESSLSGEYSVNVASFALNASGENVTGVTVTSAEGESLTAGNAYYAVVFPGKYERLKFTVNFTDGTTFYKTSNIPLTISAGGGISVAIPASGQIDYDDLYSRYIAGESITIGDKEYNKSVWGTAVLVTEDTELSTYGSKIYFVNPDATLTCAGENSFEKLAIIGNDMNTRSNVELGFEIRHNGSSNGALLFYNLNLKMNGKQLKPYGDGTYGYVGFIGCSIDTYNEASGAAPIFLNKTSTARNFNEFVIEDCDIYIQPNDSDGQRRFLFSTGSAIDSGTETDYNKIVLRNNIFWSTEKANTKFKFFNGFAGINELVVEKNTIVNLFSHTLNGLFSYRSLSALTFEDNLYYNPSNVKQYLGFFYPQNHNDYAGEVHPANPTSGNCLHNLLYQGSCKQNFAVFVNRWDAVDTSGWGAHEDITETTSDPLATKDFTNGIFIPDSEFSSYGAQR